MVNEAKKSRFDTQSVQGANREKTRMVRVRQPRASHLLDSQITRENAETDE